MKRNQRDEYLSWHLGMENVMRKSAWSSQQDHLMQFERKVGIKLLI